MRIPIDFAVASMLALAACSTNSSSPPPLPPGAPLVPSRLDGETLQISSVPFQFQLRSPRLADFNVSEIGVWQGGERVSGVEILESNSSSMTVRLLTLLVPGAYELRFAVEKEVDPRRLEAYFLPGQERGMWKLRFFAGAKFCLIRMGLCRETDKDAMSLSLLFSDTSASISEQTAKAALTLSYDGVTASCDPVTAIGRLESKEFSYRCSIPSEKAGTAQLAFSGQIVGGSESTTLADCNSGLPLTTMSMRYYKDGCGSFRW